LSHAYLCQLRYRRFRGMIRVRSGVAKSNEVQPHPAAGMRRNVRSRPRSPGLRQTPGMSSTGDGFSRKQSSTAPDPSTRPKTILDLADLQVATQRSLLALFALVTRPKFSYASLKASR
jgi:hypothetical protein